MFQSLMGTFLSRFTAAFVFLLFSMLWVLGSLSTAQGAPGFGGFTPTPKVSLSFDKDKYPVGSTQSAHVSITGAKNDTYIVKITDEAGEEVASIDLIIGGAPGSNEGDVSITLPSQPSEVTYTATAKIGEEDVSDEAKVNAVVTCGKWIHKSWEEGKVEWKFDASTDSNQAHATKATEIVEWVDNCGGTQQNDERRPVDYEDKKEELSKEVAADKMTWTRKAIFTAHSTCEGGPDSVISGEMEYCHCSVINEDGDDSDSDATEDAQGPGSGSEEISDETSGLPDAGEDDSAQGPGASTSGEGAPLWVVNHQTLNLFLQDKPLWYHSPIGPNVEVTMTYNSQSNADRPSVFGQRWLFNYISSLVEDAKSGEVTVAHPNGRRTVFVRDAQGRYASKKSGIYQLKKVGAHRFEITTNTSNNNTWVYDVVNGTDATQSVLVELRDPWKQRLTFGYNEQGRLTTITNAQNLVWALTYDAKGHVTRVEDPFKRDAKFNYDAAGNMVQASDMSGNAFDYSYDGDVKLTRLNTPLGAWKFRLEDPTKAIATASYPAPGQPMGKNRRVTITDPLDNSEEYFLDAARAQAWHVDQNHYVEFSSARNNNSPDVLKTVWSQDKEAQSATLKVKNSGVSEGGAKVKTIALAQEVAEPKKQTDATPATEKSATQEESVADSDEDSDTRYTAWGGLSRKVKAGHTFTFAYDEKTKNLAAVSRDGQLVESYTYDSIGRVKTSTKANGQTLTYSYNDLNYPTQVTYQDGTHVDYDYQFLDVVRSVTDRAGRTTKMQYDPLKRLVLRQDAAGAVSYGYDAVGNRTSLTDANGNTTRWKYDVKGRIIETVYADRSVETYEREPQSLTSVRRAPDGKITRFKHDENGNLTQIDYPNSPDVTTTYDAKNHPIEMHDGVGITKWTYDEEGRLTSMDGPWDNDTITYSYDEDDWRSSMKIAANFEVIYNRDARGRTTSIQSPSGEFRYSYAASGELSRLDLPNGTQTRFSVEDGKLSQIENLKADKSLLSRYGYTFDTAQLRTAVTQQIQRATPSTIHFDYDQTGQLTGEKSPTQATRYSYDAGGNRTAVEVGQSKQNYRYDSLNRLVDLNGTAQEFDANGNLLSDGARRYTYDDANRLTEVVVTDGATKTNKSKSEFVYDGLNHRRIVREFAWKEGQWQLKSEIHLVYDVTAVVQERDANNKVVATYTRGLERTDGVGGILSRTVSNGAGDQHFFYHYDGVGNVAQLTNAKGGVVAAYSYDAWGNILTASGPQANQPYRFNTRSYHSASGLYDFGLRFYSASTGRWINRDPIAELGGLNLYGYIGNNPLNKIDTWGLMDTGPGDYRPERRTYTPEENSDLFRDIGSFLTGMGDEFSFGATAFIRRKTGLDDGLSNIYNPAAMNYGHYATVALTLAAGVGEAKAGLAGIRAAYRGVRTADEGLTAAQAALQVARTRAASARAALASAKDKAKAWAEICRERQKLAKAVRDIKAARATKIGKANKLAKAVEAAETGPKCFVAGTLVVMSDGTLKPIERVQPGESVLSEDPVTKRFAPKKVLSKSIVTAATTLSLLLPQGERIEATPDHPFYVQGRGFVPLAKATSEARFQNSSGQSLMLKGWKTVSYGARPVPVYNFIIQDFHTYFVGKSRLWVHNGLPCSIKETLKSIKSYRKLIVEHEEKLKEYIANPLAHDNDGRLRNAPTQAIYDKIFNGRIKALNAQLIKQRGELQKLYDHLSNLRNK